MERDIWVDRRLAIWAGNEHTCDCLSGDSNLVPRHRLCKCLKETGAEALGWACSVNIPEQMVAEDHLAGPLGALLSRAFGNPWVFGAMQLYSPLILEASVS